MSLLSLWSYWPPRAITVYASPHWISWASPLLASLPLPSTSLCFVFELSLAHYYKSRTRCVVKKNPRCYILEILSNAWQQLQIGRDGPRGQNCSCCCCCCRRYPLGGYCGLVKITRLTHTRYTITPTYTLSCCNNWELQNPSMPLEVVWPPLSCIVDLVLTGQNTRYFSVIPRFLPTSNYYYIF